MLRTTLRHAAAASVSSRCVRAMASAVPEQPAGLAAEAASLISYLELAPSLSKASLLGATGDVLLQCSQRSVEENKQRTFCSVFSLSPGRAPPFGFEARGASLVVPSPSGRKLLVIRNPASDKDATLFELWENGRLASELAVPATTHGGVYADGGILEGVAWSGDEGRVAFAAEAPPAERTPSWGGRGEGDAKNGWRGVGAHVEDWGEQAGGRKRASLFVLSISVTRAAPPRTRVTTLSVAAVGGCPADASCGAPVWDPCGDRALVFVAVSHGSASLKTQRKLGLVYCQNRESALYAVAAPAHAAAASAAGAERGGAQPEAARKLTHTFASAFSPRFHPSGAHLVFLSADDAVATGSHAATLSLHLLRFGSAGSACSDAEHPPQVSCLVPTPQPGFPAFPGLYMSSGLARCPWVSDTQLAVASTWGLGDAILLITLPPPSSAPTGATAGVERLTPVDSGSWALLDAAPGVLVASRSTPVVPPQLMVATGAPWAWRTLSADDEEGGAGAAAVDGAATAADEATAAAAPAAAAATGAPPDGCRPLVWSVLPVPSADPTAPGVVEAIIIRPQPQPLSPSSPPPPLFPAVLVPHGGPHSSFSAGFVPSLAFFASQGYCVVAPNFRGSTGYGAASLTALSGRAGELDVSDCLAALDAAQAEGLAARGPACVVGGSHGGFVAAHLIAQHPTRFFAAALRNPVTDIAAMVGVTDIPEWCFVESAGLGRDAFGEPPTPAALAAMFAASPASRVASVRAPVLLLLGGRDKRVPPSNGLAFAAALRSRGVPTRTLVFPDDEHPLSKPRTEVEAWLNILDWLRQHAHPAA